MLRIFVRLTVGEHIAGVKLQMCLNAGDTLQR